MHDRLVTFWDNKNQLFRSVKIVLMKKSKKFENL